jgi:hypothetical protein
VRSQCIGNYKNILVHFHDTFLNDVHIFVEEEKWEHATEKATVREGGNNQLEHLFYEKF